MRDTKRQMVLSLAKAGYTAAEIVSTAGVSLSSVEHELDVAGLSRRCFNIRAANLARTAGWDVQVDELTDKGFEWAERVMNDPEGDPKLKFSLFKLLLEHRPDQHFSKSAKLQLSHEPDASHVVGGASIVHLRRLASEPGLDGANPENAEVVYG